MGIGEATTAPGWNGEEWAGTASLVRDRLAPLVEGADLRSWADVAARVDRAVRGRPFLRAGIEMACLDALGRTVGAARLHAARRRAARRGDDEDRAAGPGRGVRRARAPARRWSEARGRSRSRSASAWRATWPAWPASGGSPGDGLPITVDANEGWSTEEARASRRGPAGARRRGLRAAHAARGADPGRATCAAAPGRCSSPTRPLWGLRDLLDLHAAGACDVASVYPGKCGGMLEAVALVAHGGRPRPDRLVRQQPRARGGHRRAGARRRRLAGPQRRGALRRDRPALLRVVARDRRRLRALGRRQRAGRPRARRRARPATPSPPIASTADR